jgi:hypothetical protein
MLQSGSKRKKKNTYLILTNYTLQDSLSLFLSLSASLSLSVNSPLKYSVQMSTEGRLLRFLKVLFSDNFNKQRKKQNSMNRKQ